jgi:hypothetical protein
MHGKVGRRVEPARFVGFVFRRENVHERQSFSDDLS